MFFTLYSIAWLFSYRPGGGDSLSIYWYLAFEDKNGTFLPRS